MQAAPAPPPVGAGADTARADLQPDPEHTGPAMTAQAIADKVRAARSAAVVNALGKTAADLGLLDDMVDDGTGVFSQLSDVLHERLDSIAATA